MCVYRVRVFDKTRPAGDLLAEIALDADGQPPPVNELAARLAAVAASGQRDVREPDEKSARVS